MKKFLLMMALCLTTVFAAQARIVNLTSLADKSTFVAQDKDTLTGSTLGKDITIQIAKNAKVCLRNARINEGESPITNSDHAGISTLGNANIVISGDNYVRGFADQEPGVFPAKGYSLLLSGTGTLTAESAKAAGIGAARKRKSKSTASCGNIDIFGPKIYAYGGDDAAGIGGAFEASCGNILITGSQIHAVGGAGGAGIGSGSHAGANGSAYYSKCGFILMTSSYITATGGYGAAAIGCGENGLCGDIHFSNTIYSVVATKGKHAPWSVGSGYATTAVSKCGDIYVGFTYSDITEYGFTRSGYGAIYHTMGIPSNPYIYPHCTLPDQVTVTSSTQKTATVTWVSAEGIYPQNWQIRWTKYGQENWQEEIVPGTQRFHTINGLTAGTRYELEVRAICGPDNYSAWYAVEFYTSSLPECPAPTNLSLLTATSDQIHVTWDNGDQSSWIKKWAKVENDKPFDDWNWQSTTGYQNQLSIYNLEPGTQYAISIGANCGGGSQSVFVTKMFSTLISCPAPTGLRATATTDKTATLTWTPGSSEQNTWYVYYKEADAEDWTLFGTTWSSYPVTITGLKPETQYKAYIYGKCSATDRSMNTGEVMFTTQPSSCHTPENLQVEAVTSSTITVSFTPGSNDQSEWGLQYRKQGESTWDELWITTNPFTKQYLAPATTYELRVRAHCDIEDSEYSEAVIATTLPETPADRILVTKCEFIGFDTQNLEPDMTWTTDVQDKLAKSIRPANPDDVYTTTGAGSLYRLNDNGVGYTLVSYGATLDAESTYMYLIQVVIGVLNEYGKTFRFPASDEGITVDVTVNDIPWTARTSDYIVQSDYSRIQIKSPDFQVQLSEGFENVSSNKVQSTKLLINGQIYILRNGKIYTVTGQEVK